MISIFQVGWRNSPLALSFHKKTQDSDKPKLPNQIKVSKCIRLTVFTTILGWVLWLPQIRKLQRTINMQCCPRSQNQLLRWWDLNPLNGTSDPTPLHCYPTVLGERQQEAWGCGHLWHGLSLTRTLPVDSLQQETWKPHRIDPVRLHCHELGFSQYTELMLKIFYLRVISVHFSWTTSTSELT